MFYSLVLTCGLFDSPAGPFPIVWNRSFAGHVDGRLEGDKMRWVALQCRGRNLIAYLFIGFRNCLSNCLSKPLLEGKQSGGSFLHAHQWS